MPFDRSLLAPPVLDWTDGAPRDVASGDIYFSGDGADEARHVFLEGNDLPRRFATARRFVIAELGFGSGLNMLLAWNLWRLVSPHGGRLELLSFERAPFAMADLERAHAAWPQLAALSERLRSLTPPPVPGQHRLRLDHDVSLTLIYGDARTTLGRVEAAVDAWFLDGFAPSKNADLWTDDVFREVARLASGALRPTASTFSVAGEVRRGLERAGFAIEKRPGFGRKREMLVATLAARHARRIRAPWFDRQTPAPAHSVAIIGGGVAGAALTDAARRAGLASVLFESSAIGAGASGNPAALVMPRLDIGSTPAARFHVESFLHAERRYLAEAAAFRRTGVVVPCTDAADRDWQARLAAARVLPEDRLQFDNGRMILPSAGVADPAALLRALIGDAVVAPQRASRLMRDADGRLCVVTSRGAEGPFDAVVLACGADAARFVEARTLPLARVAGQIDWFPNAPAPPTALAFGPYAAPAPQGGLVIGATYDRLEAGATPRVTRDATQRNIAAVAAAAPALVEGLRAPDALSRVGVRCQTPDRLPVAGPLPDLSHYAGAYDGLRTGLRADYPRGVAIPGVFALTGLGSRGFVTAPLLAEHLIAALVGAPSPLAADVAEALDPARFFIRALKRGVKAGAD